MPTAPESAACPVDLSAFVPGVTVTALIPATRPNGATVTYEVSRRLAFTPYGYNGNTVVLNDGHTVDCALADSIAIAPDTIRHVPGDIQITYAEPEIGMRILINNAGGFHHNPGRYGYTETVVRDVEHDHTSLCPATRFKTDAYGWGCWELGDKRVKVRA